MDALIGILCLVVLIAILVKMGNHSREIEKLKQQIRDLGRQFTDSETSNRTSPESRAALPPVVEPVHAAKSVNQERKAPPLPKRDTSQSPPPLPRPKRKSFSAFDFLRSIGLWPPVQKEGSAELVLMQWWMPRIGGGLAILTIIFFAVYVAQGTPPWVKFLEMFLASVAVLGLGFYFRKKRPGLGNVLIATGLSMIYVSSVAGYAVGPVKITDNPLLGASMQIAALILNFGMGAWLKDRGILVLALVFGYVSSLFAALEGFREAALISAMLVYLAGILSYRRIGGLTLISLSLAGVYLPLAGFVGIKYIKDASVFPEFWSVIVFIGRTVSVLPVCKYVLKEPGFLESRWNRLYQSLNTTLALGLGFLFVNEFYPLGKTEFYGVLAMVFIVWSFLWAFRDLEGIEFHLFCVKGSALASLWFINYFGGDYRWMALGVQVLVLTATVHRSKSVWLEAVTGVTLLVSFNYFVSSGLNEPTGNFLWCLKLAYLWLSVAGLAFLMAHRTDRPLLRKLLYVVPSFLLAVASIVFASESRVAGIDESGIVAIMSLLLFAIVVIPRVSGWVPLIAGGLVFIVSHFMFWFEPSGVYTLSLVLFVSLICLIGLLKAKVAQQDWIETGIHALWIVTSMFYLDALSGQLWYPILVVLFSILLFWCGYSPFKRLTDLCILPLLFLIVHQPGGEPHGWLLLVFVVLLGSLANIGVVFPRFQSQPFYLRRGHLLWWVLNGLFLYWVGWVMVYAVTLTHEMLISTALGWAFFALWYLRSMWVSFVAALICALAPVYRIGLLWADPPLGGLLDGAPWAWQVLLAGVCATILWLVIGGMARIKANPKISGAGEIILAWVCAFIAYLVYATSFDYPLLNWERLYTPCLVVFSIVLIVLGIVLKSKPYRLFAMLTFLVPLFRLFVFDIRETLFRIIAFAVLTVLVTVVGFLYQKYSSRIE